MSWIYHIGVQQYLTQAERENNATEFYNYFIDYGCTVESICGMLGNIQAESDINPANKQGANINSGWGLIQWTPSTVLTNWCSSRNYRWYDGAIQCYIIECEGENKEGCGGRFYGTTDYPYTWSEFTQLTDYEEATKAYLYERERPAQPNEQARIDYARQWYEYFTGTPPPPTPPTPPIPHRKQFPIYFMIQHSIH